jgi:HK97 family phage portal protein
MSIIRKETRALPITIDPNQVTARPAFPNYSGEIVTERTSVTSSALLSAVTLLSDSVATMPLERYKKKEGHHQSMPLPSVFEKPNDEQTMFDFIHQTMASLTVHGNAFIYAPRSGIAPPVEMRNLHPLRVNVIFGENGNRVYSYGKTPLNPDDIYHISWLRFPEQAYGVSPLDALRNIIGTGIAIDRFLAQFYGDGATPSSVLETDSQVTKEQAEILRDTWEDSHWKRRRPAVLAGGLKWRSITASASDMDTMAHRESIVRDIARAYRIPLHLISGTGGDSQTYQNVESAGINFVRHTLIPWMRRIEDTLSEMLPFEEKVKFNADDLMRADLSTRVRAQQVQIASGTLTPNEAREVEGREPYEGGDEFVLNLPGAPMAGTADSPPLGVDAIPPARATS